MQIDYYYNNDNVYQIENSQTGDFIVKKRLLTFLFALVLAIGCSTTAFAAENNSGVIGYVDTQRVMQAYPDIQMTMSAIDLERQKAQQEFDSKAASLDDQGKQKLGDQLVQQVNKREADLMNPIQDKVRKAIIKVAKDQGINSVVDASAMLAGGKDLTDDVIAEITKK